MHERTEPFRPAQYVPYLSAETRRSYAFRAGDREKLEVWQRSFRAHLIRLLGIDRIQARGDAELDPECLSEEEREDHIREEWTIQTEPGYRVPFFLLLPKKLTQPKPLVLTPHGHGKAGKLTYVGEWTSQDERGQIVEGQRDIALQAVREGYVAIAPDMRGFATLRRAEDIKTDEKSSCRTLQRHALLFGRTLIGERVFDVSRLIDYAATREEIDLGRIAITGNSGGGTIAVFAPACDERIGVAVPSCYFCTFEASIGSIHHCECNYVPGIMEAGEMHDVAGLIAPRPFMAVAGREDVIFPYEAVQQAYKELSRIYEVAGVPDRCRLSTGEGGHRYYRKDVWPFVHRAFTDWM